MPIEFDRATHDEPDVIAFGLELQRWLRTHQKERPLWAIIIAVDTGGYHLYGIGPHAPGLEEMYATLKHCVAESGY